VKEGDRLTAGQTVAILNSRACASVAVDEAEAQVLHRQSFAQVQAGAKQRIGAQQAVIARLDAQRQGRYK